MSEAKLALNVCPLCGEEFTYHAVLTMKDGASGKNATHYPQHDCPSGVLFINMYNSGRLHILAELQRIRANGYTRIG